MSVKIKRILVKVIELLLILGISIVLIIILKGKLYTGYIELIMLVLWLTKDVILGNKSIVKLLFGLRIVKDKEEIENAGFIRVLLRPLFEIPVLDTLLILKDNKGLEDYIFKTKVINKKEITPNSGLGIAGLAISFILLLVIIYMIYYLGVKLNYYYDFTYYDYYTPSYSYRIDNSFKNSFVEYKYYKKINEKELKIYDNIKFTEVKYEVEEEKVKDLNDIKEETDYKKKPNTNVEEVKEEPKKEEREVTKVEKEIIEFYKNNKTDDFFKVDFNNSYMYYEEEKDHTKLIILYIEKENKLYVFEYTI